MKALASLAAVLALLAGAASAATQRSVSPPQGMHDAAFVERAAQAGMAEVQASEIALRTSQDEGVRIFAQRMVTEHSRANDSLRRLASTLEVAVPDRPSSEQQRELSALRTLRGDAFDQRYLAYFGVPAHEKAIALFEGEAKGGSDPALRRFAARTLPTLREHLQMARHLEGQLSATGPSKRTGGFAAAKSELRDAQETVADAVQTVQAMKAQPRLAGLMRQAKGLFILPHYGRGGAVVGIQGGEGVLVVRDGDGWSDPVFYNLGGVSIGVQLGAAGGRVAMLLMTDKAVEQFKSDRKFSLNADAGLAIGGFSRRAQVSGGKVEDIVVWSDTKGLYGGASVAVTDVVLDRDANRAYYGRSRVDVAQILQGQVDNPHNNVLEMVLNV